MVNYVVPFNSKFDILYIFCILLKLKKVIYKNNLLIFTLPILKTNVSFSDYNLTAIAFFLCVPLQAFNNFYFFLRTIRPNFN